MFKLVVATVIVALATPAVAQIQPDVQFALLFLRHLPQPTQSVSRVLTADSSSMPEFIKC